MHPVADQRHPELSLSAHAGGRPREDSGGRHERVAESILSVATRLLTSNPRASLADVAHAAGIGRTTLHRYFPTRDALRLALAVRSVRLLEDGFGEVDFDQPFVDALHQLTAVCLPLAPEFIFLGRNATLFELADVGVRYEQIQVRLAAAAERAIERGELRATLPAWWVAEWVMNALWATWEIVNGGYLGYREAPKLMLGTLLHGIAPPSE